MGNPTGFIEIARQDVPTRPVRERVRDWRDVSAPLSEPDVGRQAERCMNCGIPFCHAGCPLGNLIPEFNELVVRGDWRGAYERLRETNNFPEFTGRICPAPCESACVAGLVHAPVTIEQIERTVAERAWKAGWIQPHPPLERTGRRVAVVGSGPAGLACADQLNRAGHHVTVFERHDRIGGLLRYGIPDFKLEKGVLDRRIGLMAAEGVIFETGVEIGTAGGPNLEGYDAVVLCTGSTSPRDLTVPGRALDGIHFAWDYLSRQNRLVAGGDGSTIGLATGSTTESSVGSTTDLVMRSTAERDNEKKGAPASLDAAGRDIVVIGGGDTGSDCVGTANRQGARSVTQFEVLPTPPEFRPDHQPWPFMPTVLKTTSSHEEGANRHWGIMTKAFDGESRVTALRTVAVEPGPDRRLVEVPGTEQVWPADLVLLAIGYTGPDRKTIETLGLSPDARGNIAAGTDHATTRAGWFAAGDARRGQSLVVWAIAEGREAARSVDLYLEGAGVLPTRGPGDLPRV